MWWVEQRFAISFEPIQLTQGLSYGCVGHKMENLFQSHFDEKRGLTAPKLKCL